MCVGFVDGAAYGQQTAAWIDGNGSHAQAEVLDPDEIVIRRPVESSGGQDGAAGGPKRALRHALQKVIGERQGQVARSFDADDQIPEIVFKLPGPDTVDSH